MQPKYLEEYCLLAWRSKALARSDSSALRDSSLVFISAGSEVRPRVLWRRSLSVRTGSAGPIGHFSRGGSGTFAVASTGAAVSGVLVVIPLADVGSEGRLLLVPSSRFLRRIIVLTNCLSSFSERAGTIFIIVLASSLGGGGLVLRRWLLRVDSRRSFNGSGVGSF